MELSQLYRDIVETSPDGIWVIDLAGRTLYANPELARMHGSSTEEFMKLTVFDTLDEDGRRMFADHLRDVRDGKLNEDEVEVLFVRRDGTTLWIVLRESAMYDAEGALTGLLHRVTDFSERRAMIEALKASEHRLDEAQRIARVGSWDWDYQAANLISSTGIDHLFGWTAKETPQSLQGFLDLVHPDDLSLVEGAIDEAISGADSYVWVARVQGRDGWVWTRGRGVVRRDAEGLLIAMSGTHQDVTEVKEAEIALLDLVNQNVLLQAIASAANEAHTLDDVLSQASDMVLLHDDWRRARGFTVTEDGRSVVPHYVHDSGLQADLDTPEESAMELALAQECLRVGESVWDEARLTIAFQVSYADVVHAIITIASDPPLYRHQLIQDMAEAVALQLGRVAEREHAQTVLADARDAAMEASRQKSEFLATMSHEIRTPLNGVIGLNDLLMRTGLDTNQARLVSGVQVASRALLSVINDVLDFSKIEAGRLELEHLDFEVRPVFDQVTSLLEETARSRNITLRVSVDDNVPDALSGDPTRLSQVLSNLVSNAVKFTDDGEVAVHARGTTSKEQTVLTVTVTDTGIGIVPEKVAGLFAPFTQADSSTTRLYGGTGLGLAISKEIVEALGGEISYAPNTPTGSVFTFTANFGPSQGAALPSVDPVRDPRSHRGQRVLVVEDNVVNQMVAQGLLESMGYEVEIANHGIEGLEALAARSFDVVLMDVQMPYMDGYAATRALREREDDGPRMPVIAMTAAAVDGERERCLDAGMDDYLTKPVDPAALAAALGRWTAAPPEALEAEPEMTELPPTAPIQGLDTERLDMLRDLDPGNTTYLDRAISNFTVNSLAVTATIREHIVAGDADLMRQSAHKFAGSALNLGVEGAAAAARALEWLGDSGTTDGAMDLLPALDEALEHGRALLATYQATYSR